MKQQRTSEAVAHRRYLLAIYQPDGPTPPPEYLDPIVRELDTFRAELKAAGAWVFNGGLHPPSTATVVRSRGSEILTTDGPFAEGKEHLGGFTVIDAADLDEALAWGRKLAAILEPLSIEVRPFV